MAHDDKYKTRMSLLERASERDCEALAELCEFYHPMIIGRLTKDGLQDADAADVSQEVLAVLVAKLPEFKYDPTQSFRGYIRGIINRKELEHWRAQKRNKVSESVALLLCNEQYVDEIVEVLVAGEERLHFENLILAAKETSLKRGREVKWKAWLLRYRYRESAQEIARILGISVANVYTSIHRFNQLIKEIADERDLDLSDFNPNQVRFSGIED